MKEEKLHKKIKKASKDIKYIKKILKNNFECNKVSEETIGIVRESSDDLSEENLKMIKFIIDRSLNDKYDDDNHISINNRSLSISFYEDKPGKSYFECGIFVYYDEDKVSEISVRTNYNQFNCDFDPVDKFGEDYSKELLSKVKECRKYYNNMSLQYSLNRLMTECNFARDYSLNKITESKS